MLAEKLDNWGTEKAHLLEELTLVYQQMERVLLETGYEYSITYDELRQCTAARQDRLADLEETHRNLQEAQWLLVRAERMSAMGQLAAALVHEINAPLTVIGANVELLLMEEQDDANRAGLEAIAQANLGLRDLARHVLRYARHRRVAALAVDVNALVGEVLALLAPSTKAVEVETRLAAGLRPVTAAWAPLEQALVNLVANALDALAGRSGARLCVATGTEDLETLVAQEQAAGWQTALVFDAGPQARRAPWTYVEVRDNGPGMAAEVMDQIFEPFFTTKGSDQGTGLGLAVCRSIAQDHRGNILVAARVGVGASFRLLLPVESETRERI